MRCNLCGCDQFANLNKRPNVRCLGCNSVERTRIIKLVLDRNFPVQPGMSILHIAPEEGLSRHFLAAPDVRYRPVDLFPEYYPFCQVERMDLVAEAERLPSKEYDLVLHSHVMEHIPCNVTAVLMHLHRSLKDSGRHVFAIPIYPGGYEEDLRPLSGEERKRRFAQEDHMRKYGRDDIHLTIGKIFRIPEVYDISEDYREELADINVPGSAAVGYSSDAVFCLKKTDLLLTE
jgi:SAM-dependent methyltransferase